MLFNQPNVVEYSGFCKAEAYVEQRGRCGRHTPFFSGYRPQFSLRGTDVTGDMKLPQGVEMVIQGNNVSCEVWLITPVALEKGLRFAIREGGHTSLRRRRRGDNQ